MYTRILVPLDGSDRALAALGPARRLARLHGAQLWLMTVATPDTPEARVESLVARARPAAGEPTPELTVLHGVDPAAELERVVRDEPDALMCLTTRARGPMGSALFGSVAREIVRRADRAVVLIGPSCDVEDAGAIRRIVVCLDGTLEGEAILPWTTRWSASTGVPLMLVRVVYPLVEPAARVPPTEAQLDELGYVRRLALRLESDGYRVSDVTVQHPSAPDALIDVAAGLPGGLLAVSTGVAGSLEEALEGSTAAQLVRGSSVPVLVARQA